MQPGCAVRTVGRSVRRRTHTSNLCGRDFVADLDRPQPARRPSSGPNRPVESLAGRRRRASEKVIRIRTDGSEQLFFARVECVVDLGPDQKGAHMSRFEEVVNEAIGQVVLGEATFKVETLAEHIAQLVRDRQSARRAEVTISARFPEHKPAPLSGILTQELYTLHGSAICSEFGTRRLIGVTAQGITGMPVRPGARRRRRAGASRPGRLRRGRDRTDPGGGPGRHPQPAWSRHVACRLHGVLRRRDQRVDAAGDRRAVDVV